MTKHSYNKNTITIVEAEKGKYLVPKNVEQIGKPIQIIFDNSEEIPEFEEREV